MSQVILLYQPNQNSNLIFKMSLTPKGSKCEKFLRGSFVDNCCPTQLEGLVSTHADSTQFTPKMSITH